MDKSNVFLWTLYDFGNSIPTIVFYLFFSQWLVIDKQVPDLWFNMIFVAATILLFFTSPIFGSIADRSNCKIPFLKKVTFLEIFFLLACSIISLFFATNYWGILIAIVCYTLATYFYQFAFTFYDAELTDIAKPRKQGFVSGLGQAANWSGQITGILITLPLATGAIFLFGSNPRTEVLLPTTIIFALICIPIFLFFKEPGKGRKIELNLISEYKNFFRNFKKLISYPGVGRFLLGYFFFNDAMITASLNFPIYMEQVYKVSDVTKSCILMGTLITSVIGALISGWISEKIGLKKSLVYTLIAWFILFPLAAFVWDVYIFASLLIISGFLFGSTWTITRALMVRLSPREHINQAFSYYTMAERSSTFVGPIVWGSTVYLLYQYGDISYRIALLAMAIFIFIGFWIIKSIPEVETN